MTERKQFEAWFATQDYCLDWHGNDPYDHGHTMDAWAAWQAARATAEQKDSAIEECAKVCDTMANQAEGKQQFALDLCSDAIRALKSQQDAAIESKPAEQSMPEGYVLVPIEPTQEMMDAGIYQSSHDSTSADVHSIWKDMVAAAIESQRSGDGS